MKFLLKFTLLFIFTLLAFSLVAQVNTSRAMDFTVVDTDGNEYRLYDYLDDGKYALLSFSFPDCGPCQSGISSLNEVYSRFGCNRGDVIFLELTRGTSDAVVAQEAKKNTIQFPVVYVGRVNQIAQEYGVEAFPTVVLIAPDRTFVSKDIYPVTTANLSKAIFKKAGLKNAYEACSLPIPHPSRYRKVEMSLFPNPMMDNVKFNINLSKAAHIQVNILNVLGQKIKTPIDEFASNSIERNFEFKKLKPGLYLVQLVADGSIISTQRFSKIAP